MKRREFLRDGIFLSAAIGFGIGVDAINNHADTQRKYYELLEYLDDPLTARADMERAVNQGLFESMIPGHESLADKFNRNSTVIRSLFLYTLATTFATENNPALPRPLPVEFKVAADQKDIAGLPYYDPTAANPYATSVQHLPSDTHCNFVYYDFSPVGYNNTPEDIVRNGDRLGLTMTASYSDNGTSQRLSFDVPTLEKAMQLTQFLLLDPIKQANFPLLSLHYNEGQYQPDTTTKLSHTIGTIVADQLDQQIIASELFRFHEIYLEMPNLSVESMLPFVSPAGKVRYQLKYTLPTRTVTMELEAKPRYEDKKFIPIIYVNTLAIEMFKEALPAEQIAIMEERLRHQLTKELQENHSGALYQSLLTALPPFIPFSGYL